MIRCVATSFAKFIRPTNLRSFGTINFVNHDNSKTWASNYRIGQSVLDVAFEENLPMEGACNGQCACSTCHVIIEDEKEAVSFPEPDDDELDMLDLAVGVTDLSRLGCQLRLKAEHEGMTFRFPKETSNQLYQ